MTSDHSAPRLAYCVIDGNGPYMFFLHGMLSSHRQWQPNTVALGRLVRPVLIDIWGHGDSPCPVDPQAYEIDRLMKEIDWIRQILGAERVLLCGQSFGAGLTLRYSIDYPQRVIAQVFTNSVSGLSPPDVFGTDEQRMARAETIEAGGRAAIAAMPFHPSRARRIAQPLLSELIAAADRVDPRALARLITVTGPQLSVLADLHRIQCPTLLVNGSWEKAFQPLRALAAAAIADCQVADIDAGHAVTVENALAFNAAVSQFLADR